MATRSEYPHLAIDEFGFASISGTRYKVIHLAAEHYQHGWTAEEFLRQHPDLQPEQVYAALAYLYEHWDEIIAQLKQVDNATRSAQGAGGLSRDQLISRRIGE